MPELYAVNPLAAVIKPVCSVDRFALVITAQKEKILGVFYLKRKQQADSCDRKMPSVHIVPQEKVVGVWWVTATVEMVQEVLKLAVNVPKDVDGWHQLQQDGLFLEHSLGGLDQQPNFLLLQNVGHIRGSAALGLVYCVP